jgi:hypothetical protein
MTFFLRLRSKYFRYQRPPPQYEKVSHQYIAAREIVHFVFAPTWSVCSRIAARGQKEAELRAVEGGRQVPYLIGCVKSFPGIQTLLRFRVFVS